ncbi:hypothetical protein EMIT0P258_70164 [Pseudomonas sp. IT-P258]
MGYGVDSGVTTFEAGVLNVVLPVSSFACQMNISPESVRMYRKNRYLKLEVGSQSELFALFIGWLCWH